MAELNIPTELLLRRLPQLIARSLASYENLTALETQGDVKAILAHHSACRSALSHLEALLKLARWLDGRDGDQAEDEDFLRQLLDEASTAVQESDEEDQP